MIISSIHSFYNTYSIGKIIKNWINQSIRKMTNIRTVLAVNMKTRRKELEISQAELAEKIGTSPNYISKIEAEKQFPSVQMIEQIAGALECDSLDLFSNEKSEEKRIDYIRDDLLKNVCDLINATFQKL